MNRRIIKIMFLLINSAISGNLLTDEEKLQIKINDLSDLFLVSYKHDVAHLVAYALNLNHMFIKNEEFSDKFNKKMLLSIYRYEQSNNDYEKICKALEGENIKFIPLKGSVLRKYYPEPWMRTSCDIDILVQEFDLDRALTCLVDNCGYALNGKDSHDASLFSKNNVHIELHYNLLEDSLVNKSNKVLKSVWDTASKQEPFNYFLKMSDEMFYFYHIAHMAKHFQNGGCGIKPFIDLWILYGNNGLEQIKISELLKIANLLRFENAVRSLCSVWFSNAMHSDITKQMEEYVIIGGAYGTTENRIKVQQQRKGGPIKYALSKIFIPYDVIKFHYPILQNHRWLTPIMQIRRWFKLAFCGNARRVFYDLEYNINITKDEAKRTQDFLIKIGLL